MPVYDTLTTRVFPGLEHDRMAVKLNGKDERLRRLDFVAMATLAGLRASDGNAAIDELLQRLAAAVDALRVPEPCRYDEGAAAVIAKTRELWRGRIRSFAQGGYATAENQQ
ncbi:MAG: hypothetical protein ABIU95_13155 [Burkholderiales bacterium]